MLSRRHTLLGGLAAGVGAGIALGVAPGTALANSVEAEAAAAKAAQFTGRFRLAPSKRQQERVVALIDELVSEMNPMIRDLARQRMLETIVPKAGMEMLVSGGKVIVKQPKVPIQMVPDDGSPVNWTNAHGDRVTLRFRFDGDSLVQKFDGRGDRKNVLRLEGDDRLRMRSTINASVFPRPLRFRLSYKRA